MKRFAFAAILALAGWLVVELAAFAALWVRDGSPPWPQPSPARREELLRVSAAKGEVAAREAKAAELARLARGGENEEVLQPYLGYVVNPEINQVERRREQGALLVSPLGFYLPADSPSGGGAAPARDGAAGPPLRVAIFGGSVAFLCSFLSREELAAGLAALPEFRQRTVAVESYALGGYKQPQQLQALTYLLALGERPDLVVNLDGFNEVAIPYAHNLPQGVTAVYPFNWSTKVRDLPDPVLDRLRGRLEWLRDSRRRRARLFSQPVLAHSFAWNLLWEAQDSSLAADISAVEARALEHKPPVRSYLAQGPQTSYADDAELFSELAALWRRSSLQMQRLSAANGIRYYHFLQPNQYVPGAKTLSEEERRKALDPRSPYRQPVVEGYPYLREAGRDLAAAGVRFVDLVDLFRDDPETIYFDTCCHLNSRGCDLVAERIVAAVRRDLRTSAETGN